MFGRLIIELKTGTNALPIEECRLSVLTADNDIVFEETLDYENSGVSREVTLTAPDREYSLDSSSTIRPYSTYNVLVESNKFYRLRINNVQIFDRILSVLPIEMLPLPVTINRSIRTDSITFDIPEHQLNNGNGNSTEPIELPTGNNSRTVPPKSVPAVNILGGVYIPSAITVHLAAPEEEATNVTVPFIEYIKNVASSEIYPTWPQQSLRANIIAQISLALNRIYTEWYRSRGFSFDITNSTAYDQYYVYGRNIFEDISDIVDEIFNFYIRQRFSVSPFFAEYCNGTTSVCAGMSQWGTVQLAEDGLTYEDILSFYYGDVEVVRTDEIRDIEQSYPGAPLELGDSGENVRVIQEQLDRIAVNYPSIPLFAVTSEFDRATQRAVTEFQRVFVMPETGIVDKSTWYKISYAYTAVKDLAELTSEGQRATYSERLYPGRPLTLNSKGSEVLEIQYYLNRISRFIPSVLPTNIDGIYGQGTETVVKSFQRTYGLSETGIVDENTWNKIVDVFEGTIENVNQPVYTIPYDEYPGSELNIGSRGDAVLLIQQLLNVIRGIFVQIPLLAEDGIYGTATSEAVKVFERIFGFDIRGIVDEPIWNAMYDVYTSVVNGCIFAYSRVTGTTAYPGGTYRLGSSGENVRYIQNKLNTIASVLPVIPTVAVDGAFGTQTETAVKTIQGIFGLTQSGVVEEITWELLNYVFGAVRSRCLKSFAGEEPVSNPVQTEIPTFSDKNSIKDIEQQTHISFGSYAPEVLTIKKILRRYFGDTCDTGGLNYFYGFKTVALVKRYQKENGLEQTGIVDEQTRAKMKF